jgi:hypothetical protein
MISQQHNTFHWPEEETPPSPNQEQTAPTPSSWQGWSLWLRVLGVIVALMGLFAEDLLYSQDFSSLGAVLVLLVGGVSAGLIRSWWSLLIVPAVFWVEITLVEVIIYGIGSFFGNLLSPATAVVLVLLELGVLIGTPIGKKIEQRLRH